VSNSILRMWLDSRKYWKGLALIVLFAVLAGVFKTLSALYWGAAVDVGIGGYIRQMIVYALFMLLFIALDGLRTAMVYMIAGRVSEGILRDIRVRIFAVLTTADMECLEKMRSGDIAVRANNNATALSDVIAGDYTHYSRLILQALIAVFACLMLSWQLSIIFMLVLPITLLTLKLIMRPIGAMEKETRQNMGRLANVGLDAITGIHAVKIYQLEEYMSRQFSTLVDRNYVQHIKLARLGMWTTAVKYTVHIVQILILFITGALLVQNDVITVGAVLAFVAVSAYLTESISAVDQIMASAVRAKVLADRLYEVLDLPQERSGEMEPLVTEMPVQFKNVSFSYDNKTMALENISLAVGEKKKVAIVGASGSGKSTIVKLICRLYNHSEGVIKIFGVEAEKLEIHALRSELAIVTQDSFLFEGSIFDNVCLGRQDASPQMVIEALQSVGLWAFVSTLPKGIDTLLSEFGANLSGGQRQRLCIARALVRDAKLILLDEPTSALDSQTEQVLQQALDNLLKHRTALIISHRIATVQNADYVYCLDKGTVVEEGTPLQLLENRGYYYKMCKLQGLS